MLLLSQLIISTVVNTFILVYIKRISSYPPIAPSKTASDCLAAERVSAGNGRPVESKAAPPTGISWKSNSIPNI